MKAAAELTLWAVVLTAIFIGFYWWREAIEHVTGDLL